MKQISAPRRRLACTLLPLLGLLWALSLPAAAFPQGADVYGVGGGRGDFLGGLALFKFDLSAHTGPAGDFGHVGGTIEQAGNKVSYRIDVDCVNVDAGLRVAKISGTVKKVSPVPNAFGINPGDREFVSARDGGNPSASPVDSFIPPGFFFPPDCNIGTFITNANVTQGNIVVKSP